MTDSGRDTGRGLTRRQVLATTGAGGALGLAGCIGDDGIDECDVEVSLTKEVRGEVHCGEQATYVFEVCNEGDGECTGELVIEDDLPDGVSFVSVSGDWSNQGTATDVRLYNDNFSSTEGLEGGECWTAAMTVEVDSASQFSGGPPAQLENCADLVINDTDKDDACVTHDLVCESACRLSFEKGLEGEFTYGEQATYVFEVCNDQDRECTGELEIEDDLPDGVSFVSVSGNWDATVSGGVVTATNDSYGGLAPGECVTMTMTVEVDPVDEFPGDPPHEIQNCATLFQHGELIADDCVTHDVMPGGECGLTLSKEADGEFYYGQQGTYVFEICNDGDAACTSPIEVRDDLPAGLTFESISGAGWTATQSGGQVAVANDTYGSLAPGACLTFEMTVSVWPPGEAPDEVENCADLYHGGDLVTQDCASHPLSHDECDLSLTKSVDEEFHYGQENTYVFEVCNEDEEPCTGPLTIEDDLPDGISFVSIGGFWDATVSGGVVEATRDASPLDPGECIQVEMTVEVVPVDEFPGGSDQVENCADLYHDGNHMDEGCVMHPITPEACKLSFEKDTGAFGGFNYGGLGTYVYEVCNAGDTTCEGPLAIEDDLPDGISFASTGGDWSTSLSGGVVTATNDSHGGLDPGECVTMEMTVEVASVDEFPGGSDQVENCAELYSSGSFVTEDCVTHAVTPADACPPVEHVLNTGYDQDGPATLGDGADDGDWQVVTDTTGSGAVPRPSTVVDTGTVDDSWPGPFPDSRWIAHQADAAIENDPADETVAYEYCFCLHENFTDPELDLQIQADDEVADIQLNGTSLSFSGDGSVSFGSPPIEETYTDAGLFQAGENCLRVVIADTNDVVSGLNLTGTARADTADCDCEPTCDLGFTKDTQGEFTYGEQATYVYELCNLGDEECTGQFDIIDPLPDGISFAQMGAGLQGPVNNGVVEATVIKNGQTTFTLAPGECLTRTILVDVADADGFPGDPPTQVVNCAELQQDGQTVTEACVPHEITPGDECPPVAFDLNTGYDQEAGSTLPDGADDGDWQLTQDTTNSGPVPRPATVVDSNVEDFNWNGSFPDSRWVTHQEDAAVDGGATFEYEYCFCLHENFTDPVLDMQIHADDEVTDIQLNGTSLPYSGDGQFQGDPIEETYTDAGLFQAGENCLTLTVEDTQGVVAGLNVVGAMTAENADCDCGGGGEPACELLFQKDTRGEFHYGEQATYTFEVCSDPDLNDEECTGELEIQDDLPDGISLVDVSGDWTATVSGGVVTATNDSYGGLAPGECLTMEMTVDVADADGFPGDPPNEVQNCAQLHHSGQLVTEACVTHQVTSGVEPDCQFFFQKDTGGEFTYGEQATYTFEVCSDPDLNDGECTGPLTIEDDLPDGISFVSVSGDWTATVSGGVVTATNDSYGGLDPGECVTMEMTVDVADQDVFPGDPPSEVTNCAQLHHDGAQAAEDCVDHTVTR